MEHDALKELCAPHFWAILITAGTIIFLVASGQKIGPIFGAALKKIFGAPAEVNVNLGGGEMARTPKECETCGLVVDPTKCVMHQSEHERSLRNEEQIKALWANYEKMRGEMNAGFQETRQTIINGQTAILKALGQRPHDWKGTKNGGGGGFSE